MRHNTVICVVFKLQIINLKINTMSKLIFHRVQKVEVELKREPTKEEVRILEGEDENLTMFDLPEDLINWDDEEVVDEDYSSGISHNIPKNAVFS